MKFGLDWKYIFNFDVGINPAKNTENAININIVKLRLPVKLVRSPSYCIVF